MIYAFADCRLDTDRCELTRAGRRVPVEPQVLELLTLLVENRDRLVSRDEIFERIWRGRIVSDAALSSRIKSARQAIGDDGRSQRWIATRHGRGFRFCGEVEPGASEATSAAASTIGPAGSAAGSPAAELAEELRELVFVCAYAPGEDPESQRAAAAALAAAAASVSSARGGWLAPSEEGDAVLVFGLVAGGDDDAGRAVAAARALVAAVPGARAGVAAGRALVVAGDPPRISGEARRAALALAAAAAPGVVALGPNLAGEGCGRRGRIARPNPPFVGREIERAQILGLLETTRTRSAGAVALVVGEAGVGKTRLVEECAKAFAAQGGRVATIRFSGFGAERASLATRLARSFADGSAAGPAAGASDAEAAVRAVLTGRPPPPGGAALLAAMDEGLRAEAAATALVGLLDESLGGERAALVVAEDAHWADRAEIELLRRFAERLADRPVVLLVTERPVEGRFANLLRGAPIDATILRHDLSTLPPREARRLAEAMGCRDPAFVDAAFARSGGNPLFLVRLLEAGPGPEEAPPPSLVSLLQAQTSALPEDERLALRRAAILGHRFEEADFDAIFGPANLGRLVARGFLAPEDERLAFSHALLHEAVYTGLTRADRRRLHARAAARFRDGDPVRWAEHALAADAPDAAAACAAAADVLLPLYEFVRGERMIEAGLAAPGADDDTRAGLLLSRGSLRRERGELDGALADYEAAASLARSETNLLQSLVRASWVHRLRGRLDSADACLDRAETLDLASIDPDLVSEFWHQRGNQAFARGRVADCARFHAVAERLARRPLWRCRALGGLGDAAYAAGRMHTARGHFEACLRLAREHGLGVVEMGHVFMPPICAHLADPGPDVRKMADAAIARARASGIARAELLALIVAADIRILAGDAEAAEEALAAVEPLRRRIGSTRFDCEIGYNRARLLMLAGDPAGAWALLPRRVEDVPLACLGYLGAPLLGLAGWAAPGWSASRRLLDDGEALLDEAGVAHCHLWFRQHAAEAALRFGRWDVAVAQASALRAFTAAEPLGWADLVAARVELLARLGRGGSDAAHAEAAARLAARLAAADMHALVPTLHAAVAAPVRAS